MFGFVTARDGIRLRTGVFPGGDRVCVLLGGRTEFIEKYDEVIGELNRRGFTVASFDWRGQGGSERTLPDSVKGHVGDITEYDSDLACFLDEVVAPLSPNPLLLAHSMGAHIGLRALHDRPGRFGAAVLCSPMIAVSKTCAAAHLVRAVAGLQVACGRGGAYAWGTAHDDPFEMDFSRQICTGDAERFGCVQALLRDHPDLRVGGPTWGWIKAAYDAMARLRPAGYAEAIATSVLIVGAGQDRVVNLAATRAFAGRLPHGRYVEIDDSGHEILIERDAIRARFWEAFDGFTASPSAAR